MCGIAGIFGNGSSSEINLAKFQAALLTMKHRGPDAHAVKVLKQGAIFGHLRLAIIDTARENDQPFEIDDRYVMVFNGEIYNYIELRTELENLGYHFKTHGDTEVLLRSYHHWGDACVTKFNGMWAFGIYDKKLDRLFCSRDRFGIKPFNYCLHKGQFIFSSEIKFILSYFPELRVPNYNVISNYCRKSIGAQIRQTWFENIFRLEPAHNLIIEGSKMTFQRYWDYPKTIDKKINFPEAATIYRNLLTDAVKLRMRSDVPVGFTLSSGIDSTSLVCLLKGEFEGNKNTYTAAFENTPFNSSEKHGFSKNVEVNEVTLVRKLTKELGLEPHIVEVNYSNYVQQLRQIISHLESGHSSPAVLPLFQIMEVARKNVTVLLEGQGTDELLAGYITSSLPVYFLELLQKFRLKQAFWELKQFLKIYSAKTAFALLIRQSDFRWIKKLYFKFSASNSLFLNELSSFKEIDDYPYKPVGFDNVLNRHLYKAHTGTLVNLLHYGDAVSMSQSLESRLPFMDYRLVEFGFTLPSAFKIKAGLGKTIHRSAMSGIVPEYILNNPYKFGFTSPLNHIFSSNAADTPKNTLLSKRCLDRKLFKKSTLEKIFKKQEAGGKDYSRLLYRLLSVELWFREFIDPLPNGS